MNKFILTLFLFNSQFAYAIEFVGEEKLPITPTVHGHTSFGDLNGDGYNDMFVGEFHYYSSERGGFPTVGGWKKILIDNPAKIFINDKRGGFNEINQQFVVDESNLIHIDNSTARKRINIKSYRSVIFDVNDDGLNDIVASHGGVFINDGNEQFTKIVVAGIGRSNRPILKIDLDNDGVFEIFNAGKIRKRTSIEPLAYTISNSLTVGSSLEVKFADFNNDGFKDLVTYGNVINITIYLNNQSGDFSINNKVVINESELLSLLVADVDGNNFNDIVLSNGTIIKNQGDLQFVSIENSIIFDNEFVVLDFVKSKHNEFQYMLIRRRGAGDHFLLENNGEGFFNLANNFDAKFLDRSKYVVLVNDIDNDGFDDFITSIGGSGLGYNFDENSYWYNTSPLTTGRISIYYGSKHDASPSANLIEASLENRVFNSRHTEFDINNDGRKELLSSTYDDPNLQSQPGRSWGFMPHFISLNYSNKLDIHKVELFDSKPRNYKHLLTGDMNNDGLEDLIYSFIDCNEKCNKPTLRVFYNSDSGFDMGNYTDYNLDFVVDGKVIDIDGNGTNEIIQIFNDGVGEDLQTKMNIIELNNDGSYNINSFIFEDVLYDFSIIDINQDNKADIIYKDSNNIIYVIFGNDDISTLEAATVLLDTRASRIEYVLNDFDKDGDMDIYIYDDYHNRKLSLFINDGTGTYGAYANFNLPEHTHLSNFKFADFNNDNIDELVNLDTYILTVLQLDDNSTYQTIYSPFKFIVSPLNGITFTYINGIIFAYNYMNPLYEIVDFNNDNRPEILFGPILIHPQEFKFLTGLNYDPSHSGHGFSIENIGAEDQFYTVFYTYENDGFPEWYADLGLFSEAGEDYWNISDDSMDVVKFNYDYENSGVIQLTNSIDKGYLKHDNCSDSNGYINMSYGLGEGHFGSPVERGKWCSQPIVEYYQRPENNLSGLWWAGTDDSGWGFSIDLVKRETTTEMVVILYYYDGEGKPRWLIGQQSGFEVGQAITLDMDMVKGYPRGATPRELERFAAGTMTFTLNQPSQNLLNAGTMSMDVTYPGAEGGNWVRDNVPIALFTNPRR